MEANCSGYANLQNDPLDLIECRLLLSAIVELGRAGVGVTGEILGVLQRPVIFEVRGDAGAPKGVV